MVGRALLSFICLQPILYLLFYNTLYPERDTQDLSSFVNADMYYYCHLTISTSLWTFLSFATTTLSTLFEAGRASMLLYICLAIVLLGSLLSDVPSRFTKKHGRWKHKAFFPAMFFLLSSVSIPSQYIVTALACQPGRVRY